MGKSPCLNTNDGPTLERRNHSPKRYFILNHTNLQLEGDRTLLSPPALTDVVIGVGIDRLAHDIFLHEPPTPVELERAIDVIEDALMATGLAHLPRGELATSDPLLHTLIGRSGSTHAALAEVEALFQRLAAVSLGSPGRLTDPVFSRRAAAALLILRECMHHLGYRAVWIAPPIAHSPEGSDHETNH